MLDDAKDMWCQWYVTLLCDANSYRELHHKGVDDTANDSDEIEGVPGIFKVALKFRGSNY